MMIDPVSWRRPLVDDRDLVRPELLPHGHAVDPKPLAVAVVRLNERAHRVAALGLFEPARRRSDPALELVADHPRPAPDVAFAHRAGRGSGDRREHVLGLHVQAIDVVQHPVPCLADDGKAPCVVTHGAPPDRLGDQRITNHADRVRVREPDRRRQKTRLSHPFEPGQLAVSIQAVAAREHRIRPGVAVVREDHGHAGPHRLALDERGVADPYARNIGDRVPRTGGQTTDREPEIACSHAVSPRRTYAARASRTSAAQPGAPPASRPDARSSICAAVARPGRSSS